MSQNPSAEEEQAEINAEMRATQRTISRIQNWIDSPDDEIAHIYHLAGKPAPCSGRTKRAKSFSKVDE